MNPLPVVPVAGDVAIHSETLAQCLKSTSEFLGTNYQNICNGTSHYVPNGFWDFIVYGGVSILCFTFIGIMIAMVFIVLD